MVRVIVLNVDKMEYISAHKNPIILIIVAQRFPNCWWSPDVDLYTDIDRIFWSLIALMPYQQLENYDRKLKSIEECFWCNVNSLNSKWEDHVEYPIYRHWILCKGTDVVVLLFQIFYLWDRIGK